MDQYFTRLTWILNVNFIILFCNVEKIINAEIKKLQLFCSIEIWKTGIILYLYGRLGKKKNCVNENWKKKKNKMHTKKLILDENPIWTIQWIIFKRKVWKSLNKNVF